MRQWLGLVAAFIFAVQMLNFPVLPGVSGHLLGGALAATLVGPWVGALCVSVVLIVQALIFADGGLSALGLNITNMALLGTAVGYLVVVGLMKLLPRSAFGVGAAVFVASVVSVVHRVAGLRSSIRARRRGAADHRLRRDLGRDGWRARADRPG